MNNLFKYLFVLVVCISTSVVANRNGIYPTIDSNPALIDEQDYYQFLGIPMNATDAQIDAAIAQIQRDLANKMKVSQAFVENQGQLDAIKKSASDRVKSLETIRDVLVTPHKRREYDTALGFYRKKQAVIADKLSRPIIQFSPKADLNLQWKVELTNKTDEYLYCLLLDFITGKEIAPLSRSKKLLELTPQGSRDSVARINNIELPDSVTLNIYNGSDREDAQLISSHNISTVSGKRIYLDITNDGKRVLPVRQQGKTPSGLDASHNVPLGSILKLK